VRQNRDHRQIDEWMDIGKYTAVSSSPRLACTSPPSIHRSIHRSIMSHVGRKIRVALVQFDPQFGEVARNQATAAELLAPLESADIVVLSEMVFTGYVFNSKQEVAPFVERGGTGATFEWCRRQAQRLGSWVVAGFPEEVVNESDGSSVYYNSMMVVDRTGTLHTIYKKHFLYEQDEHWAAEGPEFVSIHIPEFGQVGLGICMDLSPYQFKAPFEAFEFGTFHAAAKSTLLIICNGWLFAERDADLAPGAITSTQNYWALRLKPLIGSRANVLICNRTGTERGTTAWLTNERGTGGADEIECESRNQVCRLDVCHEAGQAAVYAGTLWQQGSRSVGLYDQVDGGSRVEAWYNGVTRVRVGNTGRCLI